MLSFQQILFTLFLLIFYYIICLHFILPYISNVPTTFLLIEEPHFQIINESIIPPYPIQTGIALSEFEFNEPHYFYIQHNHSQEWISYGSYAAIPFFYTIPTFIRSTQALTIASICDIDQLYEVLQIASNYQSGPLSFAIYIHKPYQQIHITSLFSHFEQRFSNISVMHGINIGILAINTSSEFYITTYKIRDFNNNTPIAFKIPTNVLRNLAEYQVQTDWLLNIDIDFWYLSETLTNKENIKLLLESLNAMISPDRFGIKTIFIVPAFEVMEIDETSEFSYNSLTKRQLLDLIYLGEIAPFHSTMLGQRCTAYETWYRTKQSYRFDFSKIGCTYAYEPWFIIHKNISTQREYQWDNKYIGRGLNKVERVFKLRHKCFNFIIRHDLFMIHELNTVVKHHSLATNEEYKKWHAFNAEMFNVTMEQYLKEADSCLGKLDLSLQLLTSRQRMMKKYSRFSTIPDQKCKNGILSGPLFGRCQVCCPSYCKKCGGQGCSRRGADSCCIEPTLRSERYCNDTGAPCKMGLDEFCPDDVWIVS